MDFNGFAGAAKRLEDIDIPRVGARIGVGEDEIHAFMDVEAAGSGFDSKGRPKMLFEPHVFYRNLTGAKRDEAVRQRLAYAKWRAGNYPRDSYPRLEKAMLIDEAAALKACSWGLGQILGENHKMLNYATPQAMVKAFMDDEETHLEGMIEFLKGRSIDDDLRAHRWSTVARIYNGPGYRTHNYDGRMALAYAKWKKIKDTPWTPGLPDHVIEAAAAGAVANEVATTTPIVVEPAVVIHPTLPSIPDAAPPGTSGTDPVPEGPERPPSSSFWGRVAEFFRWFFGRKETSMAAKRKTPTTAQSLATLARSVEARQFSAEANLHPQQPFFGAVLAAPILKGIAGKVLDVATSKLEQVLTNPNVPVSDDKAREVAVKAAPAVLEAIKQDPVIETAINGEPLTKSVIFWAAVVAIGGAAVTAGNMVLSPEVESLSDWIGFGVTTFGALAVIFRRASFTPSK